MKHLRITSFFLASIIWLSSCKKDIPKTTANEGTVPSPTLSAPSINLSVATTADTVLTISWLEANFGYSAAINYSVEIARAGTEFANSTKINVGGKRQLKYLGSALNDLSIGFGLIPTTPGTLEIRVLAALSDSVVRKSTAVSLTVQPFQVEFPALLVKGGNAWSTPATRTNGFLLTSPNFNSQFEGYLYLPNSNGWGGDALKLISTGSGTEFGWGGTATTMTAGASGNLWFTPAPNYMKVSADVSALTLSFVPCKFYVTGDHNAWNLSSDPMTYDPSTKKLTATITFSVGNTFVFTSNGNYDNSYKINAQGQLVFAGPPLNAGNNIPAPGAGTFVVTLDLSQGNGKYSFSIQ